ncbi:arg8-vasotocin receptor-like [Penaeus japonicus]|uniref:arg8-vasotocin receptor-like n=1 Tax=Penaeus japonicus TaxID=27405 RepID=UPI001C70C1FC|nr:arg8-vasotocin receptor-like [Penaeus japonicus]
MDWTSSRYYNAQSTWDPQTTYSADANTSQALTNAFEDLSMIGDVGPSAVSSDFYDGGPSVLTASNVSGDEISAPRDEALVVWEIITLVLIFTLTVFGNVVVLFMLLVRRKKLTRMCYFILSLCMSDLITAFLNVLPQLIWEVTYRFHGGGFLCKAVKFGQLLGPYLNSYLLVMTALDRYQVICYPLSNCSWTPRSSKNMIFVAWVLALGSCTPQVFIFSYQEVTAGTWDCWASFIPPWGTKAYVTWYALSVFIVPLFILIFVYSCICRTLWVNSKLKQMDDHTRRWHNTRRPRLLVRLRPQKHRSDGEVSTCLHDPAALQREELSAPADASASTSPSGAHKPAPSLANGAGGGLTAQHIRLHPWNPRSHSVKSISRAKIKTVKLTVTVILCYVSCSAPFISVQLWHVWDPNAPSSPFYNGAAFTILTLLASLNSVVNPWIFLGFNENLLQLLRSLCACRLNSRWGRWRSPTFRSSDSTKNFRLTVFTTTEGDNQTLRRPSLSNRLTTTSN